MFKFLVMSSVPPVSRIGLITDGANSIIDPLGALRTAHRSEPVFVELSLLLVTVHVLSKVRSSNNSNRGRAERRKPVRFGPALAIRIRGNWVTA
jgi:hypothetical protein